MLFSMFFDRLMIENPSWMTNGPLIDTTMVDDDVFYDGGCILTLWMKLEGI